MDNIRQMSNFEQSNQLILNEKARSSVVEHYIDIVDSSPLNNPYKSKYYGHFCCLIYSYTTRTIPPQIVDILV